MRVALTGGAGFIGSHTAVVLLEAGHEVRIVDSFVNAARDVPERIAQVAGRAPEVTCTDITEGVRTALEGVDAVIHFAGLKSVGEAVARPLDYYRVNVGGSAVLFADMAELGLKRLVFSSSATVYGAPEVLPIPESHPLRPTNPYGRSKAMIEEMIADWGRADPSLSALSLRYFNPVGAHPSGKLGEDPATPPTNLMPLIAEVATGRRSGLRVFGDDWPTPDGTGVRDYLHVMDLAEAHLAAIEATGQGAGVEALNLGTGRGHSVHEMVAAFTRASGRELPCDIAPRRPGDVAETVADPSRATEVLGWRASRGLDEMCRDAWAWAGSR